MTTENNNIEQKILQLVDDFIDNYLGDSIDETERNVYRIKFFKGIFLKAMASFSNEMPDESVEEIERILGDSGLDNDENLDKISGYINNKFPNLDEKFLEIANEYLNDIKNILGVD